MRFPEFSPEEVQSALEEAHFHGGHAISLMHARRGESPQMFDSTEQARQKRIRLMQKSTRKLVMVSKFVGANARMERQFQAGLAGVLSAVAKPSPEAPSGLASVAAGAVQAAPSQSSGDVVEDGAPADAADAQGDADKGADEGADEAADKAADKGADKGADKAADSGRDPAAAAADDAGPAEAREAEPPAPPDSSEAARADPLAALSAADRQRAENIQSRCPWASAYEVLDALRRSNNHAGFAVDYLKRKKASDAVIARTASRNAELGGP